MLQLSKWLAFKPTNGNGAPHSQRALPAIASVALLAAMMAGCSFLQPDFSAGRVAEPAAGPTTETAQVRTVTVEEPADTPLAEQTASPSTQDSPAETESTPPEEAVTETANAGGAGPLNRILGDNVPQIATPDERDNSGEGSRRPQLTGMSALDIVAAQDEVVADIYDQVLPSVVLIKVSRNLGSPANQPDHPDIPGLPDDFFERTGGTGFVWDDQGHIVTNHHVVMEADRVIVVLPDQVELPAEFLAGDPDSDLAVLKVADPDGFLKPATLGDSDQVSMGQLAVAVGNPFGQQFSITTGIISGIGRTIRSGHSPFSIPEVLQTDAPINPGNSGGPLLDRNGHVVGVNTQIISRAGVSSGIGFAVPINIAKQVVPSLISDGEYQYSWLGISGTSLSPDVAEAMELPRRTRGALVIDVVRNGPAAKAGMAGSTGMMKLEGRDLPMGGDVIVAIEGSPVETIDDVIAYLVAKTRPDQVVTMEILRDGAPHQLEVELGKRPGS